jgi:hypothetical protein
MAAKTTTARDLSAEVAFLTRALKAPTLQGRREPVTRMDPWCNSTAMSGCLSQAAFASDGEDFSRTPPGRVGARARTIRRRRC